LLNINMVKIVTVHGPRRNSVPPEMAKAIIYQIKAYHE